MYPSFKLGIIGCLFLIDPMNPYVNLSEPKFGSLNLFELLSFFCAFCFFIWISDVVK